MNLVTGATGILGSHVVLKLLQQGKPVIACKQKNSNLEKTKQLFKYYSNNGEELFNKIIWKEVDITDVFSVEDAIDSVENVYHCAGFVSFNDKDFDKLKLINETGTSNVVNACLNKKTPFLCHVSSLACINNNDYSGELSEKVFWKTSGNESAYAISKYNAEREVWRGAEEGLNAVIVNPGVIFSAGFWDQSSSKLFDFCSRGNLFYTDGTTGYVDARDVAEIMILLTEKKVTNERFILVESNYSFKEIFSSIQLAFHKKAPVIPSGRILLNLGRIANSIFSAFSGKPPVITRSTIHSALNRQLYSNKKILSELNYKFIPIKESINLICSLKNKA